MGVILLPPIPLVRCRRRIALSQAPRNGYPNGLVCSCYASEASFTALALHLHYQQHHWPFLAAHDPKESFSCAASPHVL